MLKNSKIINKWFLVFFLSLLLHSVFLFYYLLFDTKQEVIIPEPSVYDRTLQVVIFDKKNDIPENNIQKYLSKNNFSTEKETKLKTGVADMLMESMSGALRETISSVIGAETRDFLPDLEYGDVMSLNTKSFKYYSFYERVEKGISPFWTYRIRKLLKEQSDIFKNQITKDYVAELKVFLNKDGELIKLYIQKSSGVKEFDKTCEGVFVELSPFVNPPKELLKNGYITMNWRFILSVVKQANLSIMPF